MAKTKATCVRSSGSRPPAKGGSNGGSQSSHDSPRAIVGAYSLEHVARAWDRLEAVRGRIRDGFSLVVRLENKEMVSGGVIENTNENLKANIAPLQPLLVLMKKYDLQLPPIEGLLSPIEEFYQICKTMRSSSQVYQEGWGLRRLLGRLKKFSYRDYPPQDCRISSLESKGYMGLNQPMYKQIIPLQPLTGQ